MRSRRLVLLFLAALVALASGLMLGSVAAGPSGVIRAVSDPSSIEGTILFSLRLPRVLLAFAVGAGL
ncbi:MAG TPA: iron chelate uptake ABC transporter family permease subunit, partial [Gemmatimonadales bacterium]|nr:iron chelate uptake ABC transporter family permease subunit [Gemmatimonadales bacterium]